MVAGVQTLPRINSGEFDPRLLTEQVDGCSDELVMSAFGDLPNEDEYDDNQDSAKDSEKKSQRSWLGKVGKGLYRRTIGGAKKPKDSESDGRDDADVRAMVLSCRSPMASESGGIACPSADDMKVCRSVLSLMVKQMGRNLLTGGNVMNVSFPIQCCQPKTTLEIGAAVSAPEPPAPLPAAWFAQVHLRAWRVRACAGRS